MAIDKIFFDISVLIIIATLLALLASFLRQPLILAYVIAGIIIGPVTGLVNNADFVIRLSELGIAFLLFLIGLEMDLRKLKNIGVIAAITGTFQVLITATSGFFLLTAFKIPASQAIYLALALAFGSTMIVVKLLSDKQELDTLHGRITVGILLMQDVIAIFALAFVSNMSDFSPSLISFSLLKGIALFAVTFIAARYALPSLFKRIAKSQELLFLASITWCFTLAIFANYLGYSIAIGAFLAGISLASLKYSFEIISRVKSLRDFFATIFFVSLGMHVSVASSSQLIQGVLLSAFMLIINPIAIIFIMSILGYNKKISFLSGIGITQVSEFSLILAALGLSLGHLSQQIMSIISVMAIITITITSYAIKYNHSIYNLISKPLSVFSGLSIQKIETENLPERFSPDVILCGQNRIGYSIYKKLREMKKKFIVVDYNPDVIKELTAEKVPCLYGDIGDVELIERLNFGKIELLVSTVPEFRSNSMLIKKVKEKNRNAIIIVTSDQIEEALELYQQGADYVIMPHYLGGDHASLLIDQFKDLSSIIQTRLSHISELHKRKKMGNEHLNKEKL